MDDELGGFIFCIHVRSGLIYWDWTLFCIARCSTISADESPEMTSCGSYSSCISDIADRIMDKIGEL